MTRVHKTAAMWSASTSTNVTLGISTCSHIVIRNYPFAFQDDSQGSQDSPVNKSNICFNNVHNRHELFPRCYRPYVRTRANVTTIAVHYKDAITIVPSQKNQVSYRY